MRPGKPWSPCPQEAEHSNQPPVVPWLLAEPQVIALPSQGGRIYYGWTIAAFAALIAFSSGPGQSYVFSVFVEPMIEDTGFSRSSISTLYAAGTAVSAVMISIVSRMADRYGPRRMLLAVGLGLGGVCFLMASAQSIVVFVIAFAALRALGQGSLPVNGTLLVAQWFVRYRARAISIMSLGFAASTALLPPLSRLLIEGIGWREAYGVLGILVWLLILPGAFFLVRNRPEDMGLRPDGDAAPEGLPVRPRTPRGPDTRKVFSSPSFWSLALPLATPSLVVTALIFHQTGILEEQGLSATTAGIIFVPFAVASAVAAIAAGFLIDRWGPKPAFVLSMALLLAAMGWLQTVDSNAAAAAYAVILGFSMAISQTVSGVIWAHYYGREGLGRIQGSAMTIGIAGAAIGPLPLALLQQSFGSFSGALAAMTVLPALAIIMILTARTDEPSGQPSYR
jgi:sugar phosphate permease